MHLDGVPNGGVEGSVGTYTSASHLAVELLRESYLGDRSLYLTLWVRAGLLSKGTEEGPSVPSTHRS